MVLHAEELQLHNDETTPKSNRKRHNFIAAIKLEAVQWVREKKSAKCGELKIKSAVLKFHVDQKRMREGIKPEKELKKQV